MKTALGIIIAFAVGLACRVFAIPSPAPPALTGALLVLAMTLGYAATDRLMEGRAGNEAGCAGPTGRTRAETARTAGDTE
jgi:XapX domain-containing protein